jgi:hypothetical protein
MKNSEDLSATARLETAQRSRGIRARTAPVPVRYLLVGLVMGGIWAWNNGEPLWEHAVKLLVLIMVVPTLIHRLSERRRARFGLEHGPRISLKRLIAAKVSLVVFALAVSLLLRPHLTDADYWVAAGITAAIALIGPLLHPYLIVHPSAAARAPGRADARS